MPKITTSAIKTAPIMDSQMTEWYNGTVTRSTASIIWSCLSVIVVCTYKVVHLNISPQRSIWRIWLRKFKWMFFMIMAPELLISMALQDWLWCKESIQDLANGAQAVVENTVDHFSKAPNPLESNANREMQPKTLIDPRFKWTKTHAYYANMGGFILTFPQESSLELPSTGPILPAPIHPPPVAEEHHQPIVLYAKSLYVLATEFNLKIPVISEDNIKDRSKSDAFTKTFAIGQSSWLIVQCIARRAVGLAITQLELATVGFVVLATVLYFLWWYKPFDVSQPTPVTCPGVHKDRVVARLKELFEYRYQSKFLAPTWDMFLREQRIRNWAYMNDLGLGHTTWLTCVLLIMFSGMFFSALHMVAWNWTFPSEIERWIWRSASLTATVVCVPVAILLPLLESGTANWQKYTVITVIWPFCGLYLLCRGILIVQIFVCFRSLPPNAYEDIIWTQAIPHLH